MITIRKGMFHTNSSSAHVLSVSIHENIEKILEYYKGKEINIKKITRNSNSNLIEDKIIVLLNILYETNNFDLVQNIINVLKKHHINLKISDKIKFKSMYLSDIENTSNLIKVLINNEVLLLNFLFNDVSYYDNYYLYDSEEIPLADPTSISIVVS